jgi:hypothetical protein
MEALYGPVIDYEAAIQEYEEIGVEGEDDFDGDDEGAHYWEDGEEEDVDLEALLDDITDTWPDPASLPIPVKAKLIHATSPAAESFRLYLLGHELTTRGYRGQHV